MPDSQPEKPAEYTRIRQRICARLGVDIATIDTEVSMAAATAIRAFEHLDYLWSDPYGEAEGQYYASVHSLVWDCALEVYREDSVPAEEVPVRMRGIAAQAKWPQR